MARMLVLLALDRMKTISELPRIRVAAADATSAVVRPAAKMTKTANLFGVTWSESLVRSWNGSGFRDEFVLRGRLAAEVARDRPAGDRGDGERDARGSPFPARAGAVDEDSAEHLARADGEVRRAHHERQRAAPEEVE